MIMIKRIKQGAAALLLMCVMTVLLPWCGITAFAAAALDEAVYVELPDVGVEVTAGEPCGEIESVKSVSDLVAPASGAVTEINDVVVDDPSGTAEILVLGWGSTFGPITAAARALAAGDPLTALKRVAPTTR